MAWKDYRERDLEGLKVAWALSRVAGVGPPAMGVVRRSESNMAWGRDEKQSSMCIPLLRVAGLPCTCPTWAQHGCCRGGTYWWGCEERDLEISSSSSVSSSCLIGFRSFCMTLWGEDSRGLRVTVFLLGSSCNLWWSGLYQRLGSTPLRPPRARTGFKGTWPCAVTQDSTPERGASLGLGLCCCPLEILNGFWTKGPFTFALGLQIMYLSCLEGS